jgi:membrane protein DedA with SNARE-associated domain
LDPSGINEAILALKAYGVPGIVLMSYIINLIPGFPAIYLIVIASIAIAVDDPYYETLLVVAGGVGAGLGKATLFLAAKTLGGRLAGGEGARRAKYLVEHAGKSLFIIVFLFAALPLPDDALYLPLGAAGYRLASFVLAVITGKAVMTLIVVALANAARTYIDSLLARPSTSTVAIIEGVVVFIVSMAFFMALIYKVDWPRVITTYTKHGGRAAFRVLLEEIAGLISRGFEAIAEVFSFKNKGRSEA